MKKIILENQVGVLIEKGQFVAELQPGQVKYSRIFKKQTIEVFDTRPIYTNAGDNFLTIDQSTVYIAVNFAYHIAVAGLYLKTVSDGYGVVRSVIIDAVRAWTSALTLDELLEKQNELQVELVAAVSREIEVYGLVIDRISPPVITLSRSLKQAVEAKLIAAKKSQADLEEARGRTAVLRHYANAARLVEDQPELLKLLLGQKAKSLQVQFADTPKPSKAEK